MISILGSGFGIYGYLPAALQTGYDRVGLLKKDQDSVLARPELAPFRASISWFESQEEMIRSSDSLVIARRPGDQMLWLTQELPHFTHLKKLFLEKPLAPNPDEARQCLHALVQNRIDFRIAYLFRYIRWSQQLKRLIQALSHDQTISIFWSFHAHHFQNNLQNWKRKDDAGGGVLRFYSIHLLALICEFGYQNVVQTEASGRIPGELESFSGLFVSADKPRISISVHSRSVTHRFLIQHQSAQESHPKTIVDQTDPFPFDDSHRSAQLDRRVPLLAEYLNSGPLENSLNSRIVALWEGVEKQIYR